MVTVAVLGVLSTVVLGYGVDPPPNGLVARLDVPVCHYPSGTRERESFHEAEGRIPRGTSLLGVRYPNENLWVVVGLSNLDEVERKVDFAVIADWSVEVSIQGRLIAKRVLGSAHVRPSRSISRDSVSGNPRAPLAAKQAAYWLIDFGPVAEFPAGLPVQIDLRWDSRGAKIDILQPSVAFLQFTPGTDDERASALLQQAIGYRTPWNWNPDEAERVVRKALALKPERWDAHSELAEVLYQKGRIEEAVETLAKAVALTPDPEYRLVAKHRIERWRAKPRPPRPVWPRP